MQLPLRHSKIPLYPIIPYHVNGQKKLQIKCNWFSNSAFKISVEILKSFTMPYCKDLPCSLYSAVSCSKGVFKQDVCLRFLYATKESWYVTFVMGDSCCLPMEYQWMLEQIFLFFMPITHPIALFSKENVASIMYLEINWLAWVGDLLRASSRSQNQGSNKLMIQSRKHYPGPHGHHLFFAKKFKGSLTFTQTDTHEESFI